MKKLIIALCVVILSAGIVEARPHHGPHHGSWGGPTYHFAPHHHHGSHVAAGLAIGLIGGSILNYAFNQPQTRTVTTTYAPVVVTPPIVNSQIISSPTVVTETQPCYTTTNLVTGQNTTHCNSIITSSPVVTQITN